MQRQVVTGAEFDSLDDLKETVTWQALLNPPHFSFRVSNRTGTRMTLVCRFPTCAWRVCAVNDGDGCRITQHDPEHICTSADHPVANTGIVSAVASRICEKVRSVSNYAAHSVIADMRDLGATVTYEVARKAILQAHVLLYGEDDASFSKLDAMFRAIQDVNPGTYYDIVVCH